jgi:hypothetical protein
LGFHGGLETINRTAFRRRAAPGVACDIRGFSRVAFGWRAVEWVRRKEPFHALDVSSRCSVALVHVTATDPLCTRRHADLVDAAVIADRCGDGMRSMEEIVARLWRIISAWVSHTVVNRIVPVLIVIRIGPIPAAVMRLKRVMRPADAGVCAGNNDGFTLESERPHIRRVRVNNARLDRRRSRGNTGLQRRLLDRTWLRKVIVDERISLDSRHLRAGGQRVGQLAIAFHQNRVNDIERLMLDVTIAQPLQDWFLSALGFLQKGLIHETALFALGRQISSGA